MSCLEGHFLGIRRGVEQHYEEVTFFFITFTNVCYFCHVFNVFYFYLNVFLHL